MLFRTESNRVEPAYARSDLFERRRVLMDDWGALPGPRDGGGFRVPTNTWAEAIRWGGLTEPKENISNGTTRGAQEPVGTQVQVEVLENAACGTVQTSEL